MKVGIFIVTAIGLIIFSILYVFASFSYEILENKIYIKWSILKYIPFNSLNIDIDQIVAIRTFDFKNDILAGGRIWGNLLTKKGVIIQLNKGFFKNVYITPDNPKQFMEVARNRMNSLDN